LKRLQTLVSTVAATAAVLLPLSLPGTAPASSNQEAIFQDDTLLLKKSADYSEAGGGAAFEQDEARQRGYLLEMKELGADTIHAIVYWGAYVSRPTSANHPSGDAARPSFYNRTTWQLLDSLVRQTQELGMSLILSPAGAYRGSGSIIAPRWARAGRFDNEYGKFVSVLGRRYSGSYRDENGTGILPRVRRWGIWNEPNIAGWIQPQWKRVHGKRIPWGPVIYRKLYRAGYSALARSGHRRDQILLGEFAPLGRNRRTSTSPIAPGKFLRETLCVDDRLRSYRGRDAEYRKCKGFRRLAASAIAHHVYTEGRGQPATFKGARDVFPIGNIAGLEGLVAKLGARGRISKGIGFLNTEFGFQSNPPDRFSGVSLDQQAEQENIAEYLQYKRPKWSAFTHYLMVDDVCGGARCGGFQTGLKFLNRGFKPAYDAYRMPIVVRSSGGQTRVWGANRPGGAGSSVEILRNGSVVQTIQITNSRGYFDVEVSGGSSGDSYQIRDPASGFASRVARVSPGVS
jgi:hypothetical protein